MIAEYNANSCLSRILYTKDEARLIAHWFASDASRGTPIRRRERRGNMVESYCVDW